MQAHADWEYRRKGKQRNPDHEYCNRGNTVLDLVVCTGDPFANKTRPVLIYQARKVRFR